MLVFAHVRAHAGGRIGGVAPRATLRVGATGLPQVVGPGQHQGLLPGRNRGQSQVVVAVLDGGRAQRGVRLELRRRPLLGEGDRGARAGAAARRAYILPQPLILVVLVHRPGKGVAGRGIYRQRTAEDGAGGRAGVAARIGWAELRARRQVGSRLIGHAREDDAVRGLIVAVVAHRRDKQTPHRVPHHRGGRVSIGNHKGVARPLHVRPVAVRDGGQAPVLAAVRGVVQPLVAAAGVAAKPGCIHERALVGLRNRRHHHIRTGGIGSASLDARSHIAPGKAGKALPGKAVQKVRGGLFQAPRGAAVGRVPAVIARAGRSAARLTNADYELGVLTGPVHAVGSGHDRIGEHAAGGRNG